MTSFDYAATQNIIIAIERSREKIHQ